MLLLLDAHSLLETAVRANRVDRFPPLAALVTSCVSSIFSSTATLVRDAFILQQFPALASERQRVLVTLATLVTHAKKVSKGNLARGSRKRGAEDLLWLSDDVVSSVQTFLKVAVQCGIELPQKQVEVRNATESARSGGQAPADGKGHRNAGPHSRGRMHAFPSGPTPPARVMEAVSSANDRILSAIPDFIGHAHSHPGLCASTPSLGIMYDLTTEVVEIDCRFSIVVEALVQHPEILPGRKHQLTSAMYELCYSSSFLADSVRHLAFPLPSTTPEAEKQNVIQSAMRVLKARADCYSVVKSCLRQSARDGPFIINLPIIISDLNPFTPVHPLSSLTTLGIISNTPMNAIQDAEEGRTVDPQRPRLAILESEEIIPESETDVPSRNKQNNDSRSGGSQSACSSASSRTDSTDYGLYYTRWAISQESIAQDQSQDGWIP